MKENCSNCIFSIPSEVHGKLLPENFDPFIFDRFCLFYGGLFESDGVCDNYIWILDGVAILKEHLETNG